jgi:hypothetical protein
MPQELRSPRRRRSGYPAAILAGSFILFVLAFLPNPVTDAGVSWFARKIVGRPVELKGVRFEFPFALYFQDGRLWPSSGDGPALMRGGRIVWLPGSARAEFRMKEIDFLPVFASAASSAGNFIRKHGLNEWMLVRDSHWTLTHRLGQFTLRLVDSKVGESSLVGGIRFNAQGAPSRSAAALWLPKSVWNRFSGLVGKKFPEDAEGRRLIKLTWNAGKWRLWGRSAPVLEASWR